MCYKLYLSTLDRRNSIVNDRIGFKHINNLNSLKDHFAKYKSTILIILWLHAEKRRDMFSVTYKGVLAEHLLPLMFPLISQSSLCNVRYNMHAHEKAKMLWIRLSHCDILESVQAILKLTDVLATQKSANLLTLITTKDPSEYRIHAIYIPVTKSFKV